MLHAARSGDRLGLHHLGHTPVHLALRTRLAKFVCSSTPDSTPTPGSTHVYPKAVYSSSTTVSAKEWACLDRSSYAKSETETVLPFLHNSIAVARSILSHPPSIRQA